jgi:hypothetical protein
MTRGHRGGGCWATADERNAFWWPAPDGGFRHDGQLWGGVGAFAKPRSAGPRCGDLALRLCHFMAAKSARNSGYAQVAAKSPCRGAARRCAAAFGLDSALGASLRCPPTRSNLPLSTHRQAQNTNTAYVACAISASTACAAARGSGACQMGRPITTWSAPACKALRGVATRF